MNGNKYDFRYELHRGKGRDDAIVRLDDVLAMLDGDSQRSVLVVGPPCSGKTTFAFDLLMEVLLGRKDIHAVMTVSNRHTADSFSDKVIARMGASSSSRPVTTLSAVAFRLISTVRKRCRKPLPKLLNGAEQDALLRQVTQVHGVHVNAGEPCDTCLLLRDYFGVEDWPSVMFGNDDEVRRQPRSPISPNSDRGVSDAFVMQLRDMISRMNELGVTRGDEPGIMDSLRDWSPHTERLRVQWRLAFALRRQYQDAVEGMSADEFRLDSSRLLVEGSMAAAEARDDELADYLIVDDAQDLTLAGYAFLKTLHARGTRLVFVGNPDEAVQTFRGSYPDYLFSQIRCQIGAETLRIDGVGPESIDADGRKDIPYRDLVASRVSLSVGSTVDDDVPLPSRPGKLPRFEGSLPIKCLESDHAMPNDRSLTTMMYRNETEELDDIVWRIKRAHLDAGYEWNDMAVIAHDNATVRCFGERLRRDGVPVRYSSVTRPLKDEPFVQGLFCLLELADMRNRTIDGTSMSLSAIASCIRSRIVTLMGCPLIMVGADRSHEGRPAQLSGVEAAMASLGALCAIVRESDLMEDERHVPLKGLHDQWCAMRSHVSDMRSEQTVERDDSLLRDNAASDDLPFGTDALYVLLEFGDTDAVLASIQSVCGNDPHARAFAQLWNRVGKVADGLRNLPSHDPQYALSVAWNACGVAQRWQREALNNTAAGRNANDRLDTAMRLFDYAAGATSSEDWRSLYRRIQQMRIEADSLAKVAPLDQAVTLTTPAGASGRFWPLVWIPAVQQGVWPNLAARNTMFGGEDLADLILFGQTDDVNRTVGTQLRDVLSSEQKSFLVALTRGTCHTCVSAVYNDDLVPSDFLYGYLPERFDRQKDGDPASRAYTTNASPDRFRGMDATVRGVITLARSALATQPEDCAQWKDALETLSLLSDHGVEAADPRNWPFVYGQYEDEDDAHVGGSGPADGHGESGHGTGDVTADAMNGSIAVRGTGTVHPQTHDACKPGADVTLSPSDVDSIWACPVCWLMERRFAGPRAGSVSTSFGSLIHAVAQRSSEEGLDLPSAFADETVEQRIQSVQSRMTAIYHELLQDQPSAPDAAGRYDAMRKDMSADAVLGNIASYFVRSNTSEYPIGNVKNFTVGTLRSAQCERSFSARFDVGDILDAYNALPGIECIDERALMAIMGVLCGGWPEAMDESMSIHLSGRIDRLEHRVTPDGGDGIRLIDYKTGSAPSVKQIVNDLQLVCYQLGLAFPQQGSRMGESQDGMPSVTQSLLFHVAANDAPGRSYGQESLYQPSLFAGKSLNSAAFTSRYHYPNATALLDVPQLPQDPPAGVSSEAWASFLSLRGTQAIWALTMIARVFYAAAASRSAVLEARPQPSHIRHCRMKEVCPACAGQIGTVFETRQA